MASLAIGGVDGTLWTRFRGEGVEGRVRGKTGSLNHIHGLAAYVDGGDGELYAFTFLVNEIPTHSRAVRALHTRFGQALLDPLGAGVVLHGSNPDRPQGGPMQGVRRGWSRCAVKSLSKGRRWAQALSGP